MRNKTELNNQQIPESAWKKSSRSGAGSGGDCVEVAPLVGGAAIRDSKNPKGGVLRFSRDQMTAFLADVKDGAFGKA